MPGQEHGKVQEHSEDRVLQYGALNVHYAHLQRGFKKARGCGVCSKGLEGLLASPAQESAGDEKPADSAGDGVDEKGDPALPRDLWGRPVESEVLGE